jgi:glutamate-1-semialdehyde 2,1-aminomutase
MFMRGILFHPSQYENLFVSLVHSDEDINRTLDAAREAMVAMARNRSRAYGCSAD